jgi:hypothetical protein
MSLVCFHPVARPCSAAENTACPAGEDDAEGPHPAEEDADS